MAAGYDGYIRINTKIDIKKATSSLLTLQNSMDKTDKDIKELQHKLAKLGEQDVPTDEFKALEKEIDSTTKKLDAAKQKMDKFMELHPGDSNSASFKNLQYNIAKLENKLWDAQEAQEALKQSGNAFTSGTESAEYKKVAAAIEEKQAKLKVLNKRYEEYCSKQKKVQSATKQTGGLLKTLASRFSGLMLSLLIFNQISKAFNAMINGVKQGLQNYAKYSDEYNASISQLMGSLETLKNSMAAAFAPLIQIVVPILDSFVNSLINAVNWIGQLIAALTGKNTWTKATKQAKDYRKTLDGITDSTKKSLAGFDELNVLSDSGSSGSGSGGSTEQFETEEIDGSISKLAENIKNLIEPFTQSISFWWDNIDFEPLIVSVERLKSSFEPLVGYIYDGLLWLLENVLEPLGTWTLEEALPAVINSLAMAFEILGAILEVLQPVFQWAWDTFLEPLANWTGDIIIYAINSLTNLISRLWNEVLIPFINWFKSSILPVIQPVIDGVVKAFDWLLWTVEKVIEGAIQTLDGIITFLSGVFTGDMEKAWQGIQDIISGAWTMITSIIGGALNACAEIIVGILETITDVISGAFKGIKSLISSALQGIKTIWMNIWTTLSNTVKSIFTGIWNTIKRIINSIIGGVEGMANAVVGGVNKVIGTLNNLSFTVPDWVPGIGGESWSMNIPTMNEVSLPRLATGGITTGRTIAEIGEAGKEAVLPLENHTEWMDTLAEKVNGGNAHYTFIAQLNGETIFEETVRQDELHVLATGESAFAH